MELIHVLIIFKNNETKPPIVMSKIVLVLVLLQDQDQNKTRTASLAAVLQYLL